jgi:hypothetical protein
VRTCEQISFAFTIIKERLYLDRANRNVLHNDMTMIDHALTRP